MDDKYTKKQLSVSMRVRKSCRNDVKARALRTQAKMGREGVHSWGMEDGVLRYKYWGLCWKNRRPHSEWLEMQWGPGHDRQSDHTSQFVQDSFDLCL